MDTGILGLSGAPILLQRGTWRTAFKRQVENRKSNTSRRPDLDLALPVEANASYAFRCMIFFNAIDTGMPNIAHAFVPPPGGAFRGFMESIITAFGAPFSRGMLSSITTPASALGFQTNAPSSIRGEGVLITVAAGMLTWNWAQSASVTQRHQVLPGSFIKLMRCSP